MASNFIAAFAAPAIALAALGAGSVPGIGIGGAYGPDVAQLAKSEAVAHASAVFARADLDRSGYLDTDEFAALEVVTAELARLNGFIAIETGGEARIVRIPVHAPSALPTSERVRIEAVARAQFYAAAGDDAKMSPAEFGANEQARFALADQNGNGMLAKAELVRFGAGVAAFAHADI